jgi:4-hydroxy-3-methylbut-2-enyl diphosphate reductase
MATLTEGQIREGIVRRITDYGAFVDLGGIDGLLHISEMSWTRITHPSDMVKQGQKINIMVLKYDPKSERVSLGLRQILPDPWAEIDGKYKVGDIVKCPISRLVPFGAFVQLEGGIEAIIPNTELSHKRVKRPEDVVTVGQEVEVKVIDVRAEERRMTLSLRQLQEEPEREPREYRERKESKDHESYQSSGFSGRMTLGDLLGDKLQDLVGGTEEAAAPETEDKPEEKPEEKTEE